MSICGERTICFDGWFAADLHDWFMEKYLIAGKYQELYVGKHPMGMARFQSTVFYGLVMKWLNLKVKCQEMMKSF